MSFSASRRLKSESAFRQMIIQCPSCTTKFAIDAQAIEELEAPRFHCSRCDHVFAIEESPPSIKPTSIDNNAGTPKQLSLSPRGLQIPAPLSAGVSVRAPHEASHSTDTSDAEDSDANEPQLQIPLSEVRNFDNTFSTSESFSERIQQERSGPSTIDPVPSSALRFLESDSLPAGIAQSPYTAPYAEPPYTQPFENVGPSADTVELPKNFMPLAPTQSAPTAAILAPSQARAFPSFASPVGRERQAFQWRPLLFFIAPLSAFILLLAAIAGLTWIAPATSGELTRTFFPAAPQVAPPGLFIRNARFRTVTLENGDKVSAITGTLENDSASSFDDIMLEGIIFDSAGKPLLRTRVSAASPLSKGRLRALTPDMIEEAQLASAPSSFALRAGDEHEFTLVLNHGAPTDTLHKARFYSARVYSVSYR